EAVDHRADLFSLGSVLYAMATGRPPFRASTTMAVLRRVSDDTPTPIREIRPELPEWLGAIIGRLQAKQPGERYQSAREVADLLGQYLAHEQQPAVYPTPVIPAAPPRFGPAQSEEIADAIRQIGAAWPRSAVLLSLLCLVFAVTFCLSALWFR